MRDIVLNLTPHPIALMDEEWKLIVEYPSSGIVARVQSATVETTPLEINSLVGSFEIPTTKRALDQEGVMDLPVSAPGVIYLVSSMVLDSRECIGRNDVFAPDTNEGSVVRNEKGQIIGVRKLRRP